MPARKPSPWPLARCNVCKRHPEWRGLCAGHRQTHCGLADLKVAS